MKLDTNFKKIDLPRIVICGSMSHYEIMVYCRDQLSQHKIPTVIPENERPVVKDIPKETYLKIKHDLSRQWLNEVANPRTFGILVVNKSKGGIDNYIGANAFAEIAVAFNSRKQIFLLHDLYPLYEDELLAWGVVPLLGRLEGLVSAYWQADSETKIEDSR